MSSSSFFTSFNVPFGPKLHFGDGAKTECVRLIKKYKFNKLSYENNKFRIYFLKF